MLDVRNMKCGGCSAAVKRILLQQPGVQGAAVNLLTEMAVVQVAAPAGGTGAESAEAVAAAAAAALSAKGFPSALRSMEEGVEGDAATLSQRKAEELKKRWGWGGARLLAGGRWGCCGSPHRPARRRCCVRVQLAGPAAAGLGCRRRPAMIAPPPPRSTRDLAFAWALAAVCCTHHLGHVLHALGLHQFAHTGGWTRRGEALGASRWPALLRV